MSSAAINTRMSSQLWLMLFGLSALWGSSFLLINIALTGFPPLTVVAGRVCVAAVTLALILVLSGQKLPRGRRVWGAFLLMGALNNMLPWVLGAWAQTQIPSGLTAVLNAPTPLLTAVLAHFFTSDEKLTPTRVTGVVAGLFGVVLIVGPGLLAGLDKAVLAQLACLMGACSYAASGIYGRIFRAMDVPPIGAAFGQQAMVALVIAPLALLVDQPWRLPAPGVLPVAAILTIGAVGTAIPYILFYRILATAGATNLMLVNLLIPGWAIALGALVLGERLGATSILGMVVVAVGLAIIDGRPAAAIAARWRRWRA